MRTPEPQPHWGPARSRTVQWWVALAAAEIHDGAGRLVATASSNCLVFPL